MSIGLYHNRKKYVQHAPLITTLEKIEQRNLNTTRKGLNTKILLMPHGIFVRGLFGCFERKKTAEKAKLSPRFTM